jgi:hypothetical protein
LLYQLVGSQSQREILARTLDFSNKNPIKVTLFLPNTLLELLIAVLKEPGFPSIPEQTILLGKKSLKGKHSLRELQQTPL